MQNTWLVLLPPLLIILCSYKTKNVIASLLLGIFTALCIAHDFSPTAIIPSLCSKIWATLELGSIISWKTFWSTQALFICSFLFILGILTILLQRSGGAYAYGNFIKKYLHKKWHIEAACLVLSSLLFIDDYFSNLTVGSVMKSVTDRFAIPRVKLALLANSLAAPLTVLFPVSSWVAEIIMQMQRSGITPLTHPTTLIIGDAFTLYLQTIPFFFYSLIMVLATWYYVVSQASFGIIKHHEQIAHETNNLWGGKESLDIPLHQEINNQKHAFIDFAIPVGLLLISIFGCMLLLGHWYDLPLRDVPKAAPLCFGALIGVLLSTIYLLTRKKIRIALIPSIIGEGASLMGSSVIILLLMWTLSGLLSTELSTGMYIASFLGNNIGLSLLPFMFFITALITSTLMGTAWGAMAILIPIGLRMVISLMGGETPLVMEALIILKPLLGAIVSGSLVSNHLSPISDNVLMATKSSGAYHLDVVQAQFQFSIPVVIGTGLSYLAAGLLIFHLSLSCTIALSLGIGLITTFGIFKALK